MFLQKKVEVKINSLTYSIDQNPNTASIIGSSDDITDVTIPESILYEKSEYIIKKIKSFSFSNKKSLKSIKFSKQSQIEEIENEAFRNSSLEMITIPKSVRKIGINCFSDTMNLKHIFVSPENEHFSFINDQFLVGQTDENYCFNILNDCNLYFVRPDMKKVLIPSFITDLSFSILKQVKEIIFSADSKIKYIPQKAFQDTQIEEIVIPNKVNSIFHETFSQCQKLKIVKFYEDSLLDSIGGYAFYASSIKEIKIPKGVSRIQNSAFSQCKNLEKIEFSENSFLNTIEKYAFLGSNIRSILIPSKVTAIHAGAFYYCQFLKSIEFEENSELNYIGEYAFFNTSIEKITLPSKVSIIKEKTFARCKNLQVVNFEENSFLKSIEKGAFSESSINTLIIPSKLEELQNGWCKNTNCLTSVMVSEDNKNFAKYGEDNQILIGKSNVIEDTFDILYYAPRDIKKIIIPPFIKKISSHAFSNCNQLIKVDFSLCENLLILDKKSFANTMIKKVKMPSTVTKIENGSFFNCKELTSIEFNDSNLNYIGKKSFASTKLNEFYIPSTVVEIGEKAFYECVYHPIFSPDSKITFLNKAFSFSEAERLTIPQNVKFIPDCCFRNCYELINIEFMADNLTLGDNCFLKTSVNMISCPNTKKFTFLYKSIGYYDFGRGYSYIYLAANTEIISPFVKVTCLSSDQNDFISNYYSGDDYDD